MKVKLQKKKTRVIDGHLKYVIKNIFTIERHTHNCLDLVPRKSSSTQVYDDDLSTQGRNSIKTSSRMFIFLRASLSLHSSLF